MPVFIFEAEKVPSGERERERESFIRNNLHNGVVWGAARGQALRGPGPWNFSLISGSPGDKASTRSRGPAARVTCHGNQDSPLT